VSESLIEDRCESANIAGSRILLVPVLAVPGEPAQPGLFETGFACLSDGLTTPFVFVVGTDITDAGV